MTDDSDAAARLRVQGLRLHFDELRSHILAETRPGRNQDLAIEQIEYALMRALLAATEDAPAPRKHRAADMDHVAYG